MYKSKSHDKQDAIQKTKLYNTSVRHKNNIAPPYHVKPSVEQISSMKMNHLLKTTQLNTDVYAQDRIVPTRQLVRSEINNNQALRAEVNVMRGETLQMKPSVENVSISSDSKSNREVMQLRNNTEIIYQQGALNWSYIANSIANTPSYVGPLVAAPPASTTQSVGIHTTAFLDPEDPVRGENARSQSEKGIYEDYTYAPQNKNKRLTQGHLLNANMGGKARSYNLFPISATMNDAHSAVVEDTVKHMLISVKRNRINEYAETAGHAAITAAGPALQGGADKAGYDAAINALKASGLLPGFISHVEDANSFDDLLVRLNKLPQNTGQVGISAAHDARNAQLNSVGSLAAGVEHTNRSSSQQIIADSSLTPDPMAPGNIGGTTTASVNAGASTTRGASQVAAASNAQQVYNTEITTGSSPAVARVIASTQPKGPANTLTASSDDIAAAVRNAPSTLGVSQWDNTRVFYEVKVESPGLGGSEFSPATMNQEKFVCTAYTTANDGTTPRGDGTGFNQIEIMDRAQVFNAELESLGFGAKDYFVNSFSVDPTALGPVATGAGTPGEPSQHNILDSTGTVTGHATLFNHSS